jgi:hypothetical protein
LASVAFADFDKTDGTRAYGVTVRRANLALIRGTISSIACVTAKFGEYGVARSKVSAPARRHNWSFPMGGFGKTEG